MAEHVVATVNVNGVVMGCTFCGQRVTYEGDEWPRQAAVWAVPHLKPTVLAIRAAINGHDQGWQAKR